MLQLILRKSITIEQRLNNLADVTGHILTIVGGEGTGDVELPEGIQLPLQTLEELAELNNLLKDKETKKKLV